MNVAGTNSTTSGYTPYSEIGQSQTVRDARKTLGMDDFMKLLAVQFQSQDPMKPMEDTAFIAQMAQFSSLQQSSSLVSEMAKLRATQNQMSASAYIGRTVTVEDADGLPVTGEVTAVDNTGDAPQLVIGGQNYDLSTVRRVEPTPLPQTATTTAADYPPAA